ncbi:MAG: hypothetical protein ACXWLZ_03615 [Rhizomicrobium sp.]
MQIWNYHPTTGELIGPSRADPNPVEEGEWLVPAHATPVAPPERQDGHAVVFAGSSWANVPDHRGETWWKADSEFNTEPVLIDFIGDPAEFDPPLTNVVPPAPPVVVPPLVVSALQIRLALNQLGLRAAVEAYVVTADQDTKDSWQFATEFKHGNSMIEMAAEALGKTPAEVDALFELAKSL